MLAYPKIILSRPCTNALLERLDTTRLPNLLMEWLVHLLKLLLINKKKNLQEDLQLPLESHAANLQQKTTHLKKKKETLLILIQ